MMNYYLPIKYDNIKVTGSDLRFVFGGCHTINVNNAYKLGEKNIDLIFEKDSLQRGGALWKYYIQIIL